MSYRDAMTMHPPVAATLLLMLALPSLAACQDEQREERLQAAGPEPKLVDLLRVADPAVGQRKFRQCSTCHTISPGGSNLAGPNLAGIYGKGFAEGSPRFGYTAALLAQAEQGRKWDDSTLDAWLADPQGLVPGTSMRFPGVADPLDRADIIAFLRES